jgi:hypothetical protein
MEAWACMMYNCRSAAVAPGSFFPLITITT